MIRRITIIEPMNDHLNIFSKFELPRIGATLLATILKQKGYETEVLFLKTREVLARRIDADLVGISMITATATNAYLIADTLRARGIPIVFGGPHATFFHDESLDHGDFCIAGEGESSLPVLVEALNGNLPLSEVPGLIWRENGAIRRNPLPKPVEDLDSLPFPDFTLLDQGKKKPLGELPRKGIVPMQMSRGCPFDCTFCSVTGMFGRKYRHRSTENVIEEMRRYDPKKHFLFFYDDNFCANPAHTRELLQAMIRENFGFRWSTQVRVDVARDPQLLDLMWKAGCRTLFIGIESVDPESLKAMKKGQSAEEIRHGIREIRARGIFVHGMFVFGFDTDTPEKARATVRFAIREHVDSAQFMILTPLPGSAFFKQIEAEGRILDRRWDTYDAHHVKFRPKGFSPWELQYAQIKAHAAFYSPWQVLLRLIRGSTLGFAIGVYAHALNRTWKRQERSYIRSIQAVSSM
jgi:radical SAM superfamily enzyme YgiQ (UPF0313 family)